MRVQYLTAAWRNWCVGSKIKGRQGQALRRLAFVFVMRAIAPQHG